MNSVNYSAICAVIVLSVGVLLILQQAFLTVQHVLMHRRIHELFAKIESSDEFREIFLKIDANSKNFVDICAEVVALIEKKNASIKEQERAEVERIMRARLRSRMMRHAQELELAHAH